MADNFKVPSLQLGIDIAAKEINGVKYPIFYLDKKKLGTATPSNVSASASSVTILAANTSREDAVIFNDSSSNLRIKFGTTASATSFTLLVGPNQAITLSDYTSIYTGIVTGIWEVATGTARITELTV